MAELLFLVYHAIALNSENIMNVADVFLLGNYS